MKMKPVRTSYPAGVYGCENMIVFYVPDAHPIIIEKRAERNGSVGVMYHHIYLEFENSLFNANMRRFSPYEEKIQSKYLVQVRNFFRESLSFFTPDERIKMLNLIEKKRLENVKPPKTIEEKKLTTQGVWIPTGNTIKIVRGNGHGEEHRQVYMSQTNPADLRIRKKYGKRFAYFKIDEAKIDHKPVVVLDSTQWTSRGQWIATGDTVNVKTDDGIVQRQVYKSAVDPVDVRIKKKRGNKMVYMAFH